MARWYICIKVLRQSIRVRTDQNQIFRCYVEEGIHHHDFKLLVSINSFIMEGSKGQDSSLSPYIFSSVHLDFRFFTKSTYLIYRESVFKFHHYKRDFCTTTLSNTLNK